MSTVIQEVEVGAMRRYLFGILLVAPLSGCVTESGHIHPTTLPNGSPAYFITCNSQRYDRCLNRAARVCSGPYVVQPDTQGTIRFGDPVEGIGNSDHIVVTCGSKPQ